MGLTTKRAWFRKYAGMYNFGVTKDYSKAQGRYESMVDNRDIINVALYNSLPIHTSSKKDYIVIEESGRITAPLAYYTNGVLETIDKQIEKQKEYANEAKKEIEQGNLVRFISGNVIDKTGMREYCRKVEPKGGQE